MSTEKKSAEAPSGPLYAPESHEPPAFGASRRPGGGSGPQAGAEGFDRDPEAIAWARRKIQHSIDMADRGSREARLDDEQRERWRFAAWFMRRELLGSGEGCVITAFDERLPEHCARMDHAVPLATYLTNQEQP